MKIPRIPPLPGGLGLVIRLLTVAVLALTVSREIKEMRRDSEQEKRKEE
jgi:hypothetical protein